MITSISVLFMLGGLALLLFTFVPLAIKEGFTGRILK